MEAQINWHIYGTKLRHCRQSIQGLGVADGPARRGAASACRAVHERGRSVINWRRSNSLDNICDDRRAMAMFKSIIL